MDFVEVFFFTIVVLLTAIYFISSRKFNYWSKQKNIAHIKPVPILGNYGEYILQQISLAEMTQKLCQQFPEEPMVGVFAFTEPVLLVQDPEIIKLVFAKDFYYFSSKEISEHTHKEIMTRSLLFSHGDTWKVLRQNLTPLFSSSKMRKMFYLIEQCCTMLVPSIEREMKISESIEVKRLMSGYTMDCVCSCGFGVNSQALGKKAEDNVFQNISDKIVNVSKWRGLKINIRRYWPGIFYALGLKMFPVSIYNLFSKILLDVFQSRNYKPTSRQDFVDLVLGLKENDYISGDSMRNLIDDNGGKKVHLKIDDEFLVAQCLILFAAGFETAASTLSFTLFELAKHPEAQEKAIAEVDAYVQSKENLQYDCVASLPYLNQCVDESLRMYPVIGVITREVYEKYTFPNGVTMHKGTRVHLPAYHMHRNPKYFPDPEQFRPERFSPEQKKNIKPYSYFPFGDGPRTCIGYRFAKMQMIAGLATILQNYRLELADGMPTKLKFDPKSLATQSESGIHIKFIPR